MDTPKEFATKRIYNRRIKEFKTLINALKDQVKIDPQSEPSEGDMATIAYINKQLVELVQNVAIKESIQDECPN